MIAWISLPAQVEVAPSLPLKARYDWGYLGRDGEGRGTLDVLIEPATGRVILELHGLGERMLLLQGDGNQGYRLQIPRHEVDQTEASLRSLDLPFLPQLGSVEALVRLFSEGTGPGVSVTKKDALGPLKLRYEGKDPDGKAVKVWLTRLKFEPGSAPRIEGNK